MDITEVSDEELARFKRVVDRELERRRTLSSAESRLDDITREVLAARGTAEGDAWVQPTGATDAYPAGWRLTHKGKTWVSLVSGNVWEPGVSAWREEASDDVPEWVQPTGAHDAYQTGDHVMFKGTEYASTIDNNTWSPSAYPAGWEKIS